MCSRSVAVSTVPFHGTSTGSNPVENAKKFRLAVQLQVPIRKILPKDSGHVFEKYR